jgi:hypothetical protein
VIADVSVLPMDRDIVLSFQTVTIAGIRIVSVVRWRRPARHAEQGVIDGGYREKGPAHFRGIRRDE